jgi:sec-independent protein translocase protein TatB
MFGIGFGEMLIIAVVLLIAVGPKQLPMLMKTVGKGMREVRRASNELRKSTGIDELLRDEEIRNPLKPSTPPPRYALRPSDRERENPREGIDTAHARTQDEARIPAGPSVAGGSQAEPPASAGSTGEG